MFDVFRFAWFAVRTFFGVIALVLALYAALWVFVKILSAAPGNDAAGAAIRRANSDSGQAVRRDGAAPVVPLDRGGCSETRGPACDRR